MLILLDQLIANFGGLVHLEDPSVPIELIRVELSVLALFLPLRAMQQHAHELYSVLARIITTGRQYLFEYKCVLNQSIIEHNDLTMPELK